MKKVQLLILTLISSLIFVTTACEKEMPEPPVGGNGGSGGSSSGCPIGTWKTPTCSNGAGGLVYHFGSNGQGYSSNPDCNGICTAMIFRFKYTISGNKITYNFTSTDDVVCSGTNYGRPATPTGTHSITFTCGDNGNKLTTQTVNIQTGVVSTTVFTRQ